MRGAGDGHGSGPRGRDGGTTRARRVRNLTAIDEGALALAGGKAVNLGTLARIEGVRVPAGFCVTTDAFRDATAHLPALDERLDALERLDKEGAEDADATRALAAAIRRIIEDAPLPAGLADEVTEALTALGERTGCAVRSSATAEDLPTASFAGQQDTYLHVVGAAEVLRHIRRCWASLFTERAVVYRRRNGIGHRDVRMAVIVQEMVLPYASGILFTADPVTGDRTTATLDAGLGLGETLVSGLAEPDRYRVRRGEIVSRSVAPKHRVLRARPGGGTEEAAVDERLRGRPALTDDQVLRLVDTGRRIEAHAGRPQDIEWCLADDGSFRVVQSRPITTLFPVPEAGDDENHVYVSVGHGQMMTDAMKPLGLSVWRRTALTPMCEAGGRLFVDVTRRLAAPAARAALLEAMGRGDPLVRDALETVLDRGDFVPTLPDAAPPAPPAPDAGTPAHPDPAVVDELIERSRASLDALERGIRTVSGPALFDFLDEALAEQRALLGDPLSMRAIMASHEGTWWLGEKLGEWLGEKNAVDTLTLSAPGNITSEMGLALLDVADVVRPRPEVVARLREARDDGFLDGLAEVEGGAEARDALASFLDRYGMRCAGEIDITRPRWAENPSTLVPAILDNVRNFGPGAAARRFDEGLRRAREKEREVLERVRALPDGERRAEETKRMIDQVRAFIGYREYPKYALVSRMLVYKRALLAEAGRLVREGALADPEDIFYLTYEELREAVRTRRVDEALVRRREAEFRSFHALTPPRVLTSDGEALTGSHRRDDAPPGALVGVPASTGTVEGRARVVLDLARADLAAGDILVTAFTDPSWTALFVGIAGLVTEVGGQMTHGAVIAREYGLPAVVGVPRATTLIRDGQRIRLHGAEGYVEILD